MERLSVSGKNSEWEKKSGPPYCVFLGMKKERGNSQALVAPKLQAPSMPGYRSAPNTG